LAEHILIKSTCTTKTVLFS